jgi:GDPmannose 4,6-dehydratase
MLQQDKADDYVLATNEYHSVREFVECSFKEKGLELVWKGEGVNEIGYDKNTGKEYVFISEKYYRPTEVEELLGDASKAKRELGWTPKITFNELVKEMVAAE